MIWRGVAETRCTKQEFPKHTIGLKKKTKILDWIKLTSSLRNSTFFIFLQFHFFSSNVIIESAISEKRANIQNTHYLII